MEDVRTTLSQAFGWVVVMAVIGIAVSLFGGSNSQPSHAGRESSAVAAETTPAAPAGKEVQPVATTEPTVEQGQSPVAEPATFTMTCPERVPIYGGWVDITMGLADLKAYPPYRVHIDYGDGHQYENDDKHLRSVFIHRYVSAGNFEVTATLTDRLLNVVQSSCTVPVVAVALGQVSESGGGTSALCADGTLTTSAGKQGACSSHGGLSESYSPPSLGGSGTTWVQPYTRADGTHVSGYYRQ